MARARPMAKRPGVTPAARRSTASEKPPPSRAPARRETLAGRTSRMEELLRRLHRAYPESRISLDFSGDFQLLVAVVLSAQCTDERVNRVTPRLFAELPDAKAFAAAPRDRIEELIRSTGFFRSKARNLQGMARMLQERHGGRVPDKMEELVELPGVARKTANVVLHNAFRRAEGIAVDTHVTRLANRLGLAQGHDARRIERELLRVTPPRERGVLTHLFIDHGRAVCIGRGRPFCEKCVLADLCPSAFRVGGGRGWRAEVRGGRGRKKGRRRPATGGA